MSDDLANDLRLQMIYNMHMTVVASLAFTWGGDDLMLPIDHHIVIAAGPSPTKVALSLGLLSGELVQDGYSLVGELSLTESGQALVLQLREEFRERAS